MKETEIDGIGDLKNSHSAHYYGDDDYDDDKVRMMMMMMMMVMMMMMMTLTICTQLHKILSH